MALLDLLARVAEANDGTVESRDGNLVRIAVRPTLDSGAPPPIYGIGVSVVGGALRAREYGTRFLPTYCPERHINVDGSFCLYWTEEEPLVFLNEDDVLLWWGKLLTFLRRQIAADSLRRWPGKGDARAHGAEAARHQAAAERAACTLGGRFPAALNEGRLTAKRSRTGGHKRTRLLLDGLRVVSVDVDAGRVMTLRSRCPCARVDGKPLPIVACADHASALATLALSLELWAKAEREFFESAAVCGHHCCGSVEGCPLPLDERESLRKAA
ncbi:E2 domain-associated cysteine-rich protein [Fulvimarina sp. MAC8]|uniref:E2 domain-associated cysteine-rich protein n=1 Tax=Fulvimarina sp. MAC8 TaxID=3162874 RepID=UPI0032EDF2F5